MSNSNDGTSGGSITSSSTPQEIEKAVYDAVSLESLHYLCIFVNAYLIHLFHWASFFDSATSAMMNRELHKS